MTDRQPTKPNRYAVYDDAHNFLRYEYHERADEPTQAGDALNKANLLPDAVATALGLTGNPQVKDALAKIKTLIDGNTTLANSKAKIATGSYTGTGTYGSSNRNSITFNFAPKMIFILPDDANYTGKFFTMWINGMNCAGSRTDYVYPYQLHTNLSGKTFTFYGDRDAESQLNNSGTVYYYFAIG